MQYFAYGSNMSSARLIARTPSARPVGAACLPRHRLAFHKRGLDGSGKADAFATGSDGDHIWGVVYRLAAYEVAALDRAESLGTGYEKIDVRVVAADGAAVKAFTYCALDIDPNGRPFCWYKQHVLKGAEEHALPADYIAMIKAALHVTDRDQQRVARESAIYADIRSRGIRG